MSFVFMPGAARYIREGALTEKGAQSEQTRRLKLLAETEARETLARKLQYRRDKKNRAKNR